MMPGRIAPERLAAVDAALTTAGESFAAYAAHFAELLRTHELSAAHQAMFDLLDEEASPVQIHWICTAAIGQEALRQHELDIVTDAVEYLNGVVLSGSLTMRRAAELLGDWGRRGELSEAQVQQILARYPDPRDYERQVSGR